MFFGSEVFPRRTSLIEVFRKVQPRKGRDHNKHDRKKKKKKKGKERRKKEKNHKKTSRKKKTESEIWRMRKQISRKR